MITEKASRLRTSAEELGINRVACLAIDLENNTQFPNEVQEEAISSFAKELDYAEQEIRKVLGESNS
jgi:hypothetical protein